MRKRLVRHLGIAIVGAALALLAVACGTAEPTATPTEGPEPTATEQAPEQPAEPTATATAAPSFDAAEYFRGKTIRLMTSSQPGGGTDVQMRFMASRMSQFIPGQPRIIASNVPPHVVGKNFLYQAKPDGLTIGYFSTSPLREERFPNAVYDSTKFTYIAEVASSVNVLTVTNDLGYRTIEDIMGATSPELVMMTDASDPGAVDANVLAWMLIADFLELPLKIVRTAERGTGPVLLAMERGDINTHAWGGGAWFLVPAQRPGWFSDGFLVPVLHYGPNRSFKGNTEVPEANFPHIYDFISAEQKEMWTGLTEAPTNMSQPLVMPPDVPPDIANAVIQAFKAAFEDEQFCADWERTGGVLCVWTPGEELTQRAIDGQRAMAQWADEYDTVAADLYNKYVQ